MSSFKKGGMLGLVLLTLAGCGFHPLYGRTADHGSPRLLQSIYIRTIDDRLGQKLRNELLDRITPTGTPEQPTYTLTTSLSERETNVAIRTDATITRSNLSITAVMILTDSAKGRILYRTTVVATESYNILDNVPFATVSAKEDAENRAVRQISDQARTRLAVWFDQGMPYDPTLQDLR